MADHPIIFSAPTIKALLAGRKSQTRLVLKSQPPHQENFFGSSFGLDQETGFPKSYDVRFAVSDRLWVRETWCARGTGVWTVAHARRRIATDQRIIYAADGGNGPWWPSIHMPREFSRITLVVTEVSIQRLQEIDRDDAMAEGIVQTWGDFAGDPPAWALRKGEYDSCFYDNRTSVENFSLFWESLHGPGSWKANPWVSAISFETHLFKIDAVPKVGSAANETSHG